MTYKNGIRLEYGYWDIQGDGYMGKERTVTISERDFEKLLYDSQRYLADRVKNLVCNVPEGADSHRDRLERYPR